MSALQDVAEQADGGGIEHDEAPARDWEAEARDMGWRPKDEFKGDADLWVDAEPYVRRGEKIMPLLKSQNKALRDELAQLRKEVKKASDYFSSAEQRAYEKAVADIKAKATAAAEIGDTRAVEAAMDEAAKLRVEVKESAPESDLTKDSFVEWLIDNDWYSKDDLKKAFADKEADKLAAKRGGILMMEDLIAVAQLVEQRFSARKTKPAAVEGASRPTGKRGGRSFDDLPAEAKRQADKWVKQGLLKSRDDYVKNYQWD